MSLYLDELQLQNRAGGVHWDMVVGRHELPQARIQTSHIPFLAGQRQEPSLADRRRIELESRVLAIPDAVAHQAFIDELKRILDPSRSTPVLVRDTLPNGLERWCYAWPRALDVERIGGRTATPMHAGSAALEALDPFWYAPNGAALADTDLLADDGHVADGGAEVPLAATTTVDALSTADVHALRVTIVGPADPGIEVAQADLGVGFRIPDGLLAGEVLVVDEATREVRLDGVLARARIELLDANRHGEYLHLAPRINRLTVAGAAASVRLLFQRTYL